MAIKTFYLLKYGVAALFGRTVKAVFVSILIASLFIVSPFEKNNKIVALIDTPSPQISPQPSEKPTDERFKYLGWWGDINYEQAGIYKEATRESEKLGIFSTVNRVKVLEEVSGEMIGSSNLWYRIDGGMYPGAYVFSADVTPAIQPAPPSEPRIPAEVKAGEYWVDVDLTKKVLSLFLYDTPVFATYVSTGVYTNPTLSGTYRIQQKFVKTRMRGRPPTAAKVYDLPNVPYVMYYYGSFSLHGTYWHDKFGTRQSSGCTNLTRGDAKYIFDRVSPVITPAMENFIHSTPDNPGTVIFNHY